MNKIRLKTVLFWPREILEPKLWNAVDETSRNVLRDWMINRHILKGACKSVIPVHSSPFKMKQKVVSRVCPKQKGGRGTRNERDIVGRSRWDVSIGALFSVCTLHLLSTEDGTRLNIRSIDGVASSLSTQPSHGYCPAYIPSFAEVRFVP